MNIISQYIKIELISEKLIFKANFDFKNEKYFSFQSYSLIFILSFFFVVIDSTHLGFLQMIFQFFII